MSIVKGPYEILIRFRPQLHAGVVRFGISGAQVQDQTVLQDGETLEILKLHDARPAGAPPDGFPLSDAVGAQIAEGLAAAAPVLAQVEPLLAEISRLQGLLAGAPAADAPPPREPKTLGPAPDAGSHMMPFAPPPKPPPPLPEGAVIFSEDGTDYVITPEDSGRINSAVLLLLNGSAPVPVELGSGQTLAVTESNAQALAAAIAGG